MNLQREQPRAKWGNHIGLATTVYRILAFAVATAQIFVYGPAHYLVAPPVILISVVGVYTLFKLLHPVRWHHGGILTFGLIGSDVIICSFLVVSTGGLFSPFLLYTLAPVLSAAIFLDSRVTFGIAGLLGTHVIVSHVYNPFYLTETSAYTLSYFLVYVTAVCLTATLPYVVNINVRQRLESEDTLRERQRLSREIHDGTAQTLSALCWQVQLLRRRLANIGIEADEVKQMEKLAETARQDTRESLELLRNYTGDGSFLPHLKDYLEHLSQAADIGFGLDVEADHLHLAAPVELQLLRICQEALTNIRKHSGARHVQAKVKSVNSHIVVTIADDGCGFDALAYYRDHAQPPGHGLAVMRERAELTGGKFRVLSMPGRGTEVQIEVPCSSRRGKV